MVKRYYYKEYMADWEKKNRKRRTEAARKRREKLKRETGWSNTENTRRNAKIKRDKIRQDFLSMYGGQRSCCGEKDFGFLTIEHVQGQRGLPRGKRELSTNAYVNALKEFRPDKYDVLCFNCNCGKFRNGGICPHKA